MANTDFDWTFDDAPNEEASQPPAPVRPSKAAARRQPAPPSPRPARPPTAQAQPGARSTQQRRWRVAALALTPLIVAGLAAYLIYAVGWQRVRAQLAREIAYEDEQSRAGNVNAVMALHAWGNEPWQRRRTAEVAAGLAAPLPAPNLIPLAEPPQLVAVDTFGERLFTSTVVRQFTDSSGEVYRFRYTQRYFNNGPGLWQRLPPDEARLAATTIWTGRRISVTYPVADEAWMATALPEIDGYLTAACADWGCPTELALPVVFSGELDDMPRLPTPERKITVAGGYPLIFDTPFRPPRYPRLVVLSSPQLAGAPHDEDASQALVRALTADLLGQLAAETAGAYRAQHFYFLDALVARAEVRLGLSAAPPRQPTLADYLPATDLWQDSPGSGGGASPPLVMPRLQAVWFLNTVLGERLPSADAALLATVREASGLTDWLAAVQVDGPAAIAAWEAEVTGALGSVGPPDWSQLDGLAYSCAGSAWFVGAQGLQELPEIPGLAWSGPLAMSPDGQQIAAPAILSDTRHLQLVSAAGLTATVVVDHAAYPVGWAATGELVVADQTPSAGREVTRLRVYDVSTGWFAPVTGMEYIANRAGPVWSADREAFAFTLSDGLAALDARTLPAIVTFDEPFRLLVAAWQGHSPTFSPDGRWLAYVTNQAVGALAVSNEARVEILDLESRATYVALSRTDLPTEHTSGQFAALHWSPDGRHLALIVRQSSGDQLFLLRLGAAPPDPLRATELVPLPTGSYELLGFSADGEYLAVAENAGRGARLLVLDLSATGAPVFEANAGQAVWSPEGHRLAIANAAGLYVADPASGQTEWVAGGDCHPTWHAAD